MSQSDAAHTDSPPQSQPRIHPTALVHPQAKLGAGVVVGPFSLIGAHVQLGEGCEIGAHVVMENRVRVGQRSRVLHGAVVGSVPQDLKYTGADSEVVIGDETTIREYATINIATAEGERTRIGSHCLLMAYSHVAHNCTLGDHVIIANAVNLAGHVTIDDHAIIGGVTPVHQFVLIGAHAFVGGGSRIPQDVPPFVKVAGTPPVPGGINSVGLARRGFNDEQIARIKRAYRAIYRRGLRLEEAAAEIAQEGADQVGRIFADFFARSHRGIVR